MRYRRYTAQRTLSACFRRGPRAQPAAAAEKQRRAYRMRMVQHRIQSPSHTTALVADYASLLPHAINLFPCRAASYCQRHTVQQTASTLAGFLEGDTTDISRRSDAPERLQAKKP